MARRIELVSILLASLAAVAALWYSNVQMRQANDQARQERALVKEGQITDRYTAAVGNLGADRTDVRLGGVYALQRIMQDSPRDHPTIANVLGAYVRTHAAKPPTKGQDIPADVDAALTVMATRDATRDGEDFRLDFRSVRLPGVEFLSADLTSAWVHRADLTGAYLYGTDLTNAVMIETDLTDAIMVETDLAGVILTGADLTGAVLIDVDMRHANLTDVDLRGADLSEARNLTKEQIEFARTDGETRLPVGLS
ncbi:pentapeptide repeat-containing protein [Streptomyces niveus]|uniref:pentapeptide repeat-containing protein n=1 Tax=Streptomyces niveus TaxID=193462 RepID=UPI0036A9706D